MKQVEDWSAGIEERLSEKSSVEDQTIKMLGELQKYGFDFSAWDSHRRRAVLSEAIKNLKPSEFIDDRRRS